MKKWPITCITGILIIIISWGAVIISVLLAPPPFSPLTNYLSSLGNSIYNPDGAIIYNSSVIITGFLFLIFFIGFNQWYTNVRLDKIILSAIQIIGCFLSIIIVLTGLFSEDFYMEQHVLLSIIAGILGFLVQVSITFYLIKQEESIKKISYSIFGLMVLYIVLLFILSPQHVLTEWVVRAIGDVSLILMIYNLNYIYQVRNKTNS